MAMEDALQIQDDVLRPIEDGLYTMKPMRTSMCIIAPAFGTDNLEALLSYKFANVVDFT